MAEVNNAVNEKMEKMANSVESKPMGGENSVKDQQDGNEMANANSHSSPTPNGKESGVHMTPPKEQVEHPTTTKEEPPKAEATAEKPSPNVEGKQATNVIANEIEQEMKSATVQPSESAPTESTTEKPPAETEAKEETAADEQEEPAASGKRGRPRGGGKGKQRGGAAAARGKKKADSEEQAAEGTPEEEEKKTEETGEKKETEAATKPKSQPRGRKRGAGAAGEETVSKQTKTEEGGSSGADQAKTPLFNEPLIVEGKRARTQTQRLDSSILADSEHKKGPTEVPKGSGMKLAEIPFVEAMITKMQANDLKPLHRLCFGRMGSSHEIRKNLRSFNGFEFEKGSDGYTKKVKHMDNWTIKQLRSICDVLGLDKASSKEANQTAIVDFLMKPEDKGRKPPASKSKKRKSTGGGSKKAAKRTKKASGDETSGKSEESEEGDEGDSAEDTEEKSAEEPSAESETEKPKGKRAAKGGTAKKGAASASTSTAASTSKKAPARGKASTSKAGKKTPPTDEELTQTIKDFLQGADLEQVTMRDMTRRVFNKYPEFDLNDRKEFIKTTVKAVIASQNE